MDELEIKNIISSVQLQFMASTKRIRTKQVRLTLLITMVKVSMKLKKKMRNGIIKIQKTSLLQ